MRNKRLKGCFSGKIIVMFNRDIEALYAQIIKLYLINQGF